MHWAAYILEQSSSNYIYDTLLIWMYLILVSQFKSV